MSSTFQVDLSDFTELEERLAEYQGNSEKVINNVLLGQGAEEIMKSINILIPVSSRKLTKSHKKHAKNISKNLIRKEVQGQPLAVVVKSNSSTRYLYFPDDGKKKKKHAGQQHFMFRGAENAREKVMRLCLEGLAEI